MSAPGSVVLDRAGTRPPVGLSVRRRAVWTSCDQVLSSATNVGVSLLVANAVSVSSFGAFGVAFLAYSFTVGLCRAGITEPMIVRLSGSGAPLRAAASSATGAALLLGVAAAIGCALAAGLLPGRLAAALSALAVGLPGLLLQDAWRQYFFAAGRPAAATLNDAVWAACLLASTSALLLSDRATLFLLTLAWALSASVAAGFGVLQAGVVPQVRAAGRWLRDHRDINLRLSLEYAVGTSAVNVTVLVLGLVGGLAAVGAFRAAQVLLGPAQVLFAALSSLALPVLSQRADGDRARLLRPAVLLSALGSLSASVLLVAVLVLPDAGGRRLLGDSWAGAQDVLLPLGVMVVLIGLSTGSTLLVRALGLAGALLRISSAQAVAIVVLGSAGAVLGGAAGAAAGLAGAHLVGLVWQWRLVLQLRLGGRGRHAAAAGPPVSRPGG